MIPKNAVMPRAAGTDKRIVASLVWVQGIKPHSKNLVASRCGDFRPGTLCAFIASFFRNISGFFTYSQTNQNVS